MSCVCVIYHTLLIALFAFSFLRYVAYIALVLELVVYTVQLKITQTWKNTEYGYRYRDISKYHRYRIPNRLLKIAKKYRL